MLNILPVIIFMKCKLFLNAGDIYTEIVGRDSILRTRNVVIDK